MRHEPGTLAYFKELFELAPAAYIVTDAHLAIEDANTAAVKLLRSPLGELMGRTLTSFVEQGERAIFQRMVNESLIALKQLVQPLTLEPVSGDEVEVLYSACVVHDTKGGVSAIHWLLIEGFEGGQGELL
ncbi:MAG: PAS domain-containing protein [Gemmatimonadaceae bacterium]